MKEEIARKYFQHLINVVDFFHSRGVTHHDLKPENLLLNENEDLKVRLIFNLLVVDPEKGYSLPDIMKDPWFQVGFMRPIVFSMKETVVEDNIDFNRDDVGGSGNVSGSEDGNNNSNHSRELVGAKPARPSYNAFEIISSLSHEFDLSNLFETRKRSPSMFISKHSASSVMAKLEAMAKKLNFRVTGKKQFTVRMQGATKGRKGKLGMIVEVFKLQ
ncbi:CBL-interacting serine/threonine-protein [Vigna angularis]|uniref:non-specific serine/threonine protein kinase n=1 Tax=Phaseolus angularis TaxID=3914 RepID=A0A8T0KZV2_PHAAN|nr:CBL-interacting serine/threonine-protein [Vigna angularis]